MQYKPLSPAAQELRRLQLEAARRVMEWHAKRLSESPAAAATR